MSSIVAYLIVAITIQIVHNVMAASGSSKGEQSRALGLITLVMILGMTTSVIVAVIVVSGIITIAIAEIDEETTTLFELGIAGLIIITGTDSLILIYLGLELIGLTFYILASRERKGVKSTEAGIKYFILGALSSGIMLLGMSLSYATTGTTSLELVTGASATMIKIGILFKLGATPFHMWVPDVYEGSPIIVTIFLAVVPKIAYMTVLMRIVMAQGAATSDEIILLSGVLSIIVGSLGALNQTKLKRMLAYSAIGHMGFMLIGVGIGTYASYQATIVYMILYIIMTINSFTMIKELGLQKIVEVRGLSRRNGIVGLTMGLGLMSIAGIPPLAGFYNKYLVLLSAVENGAIAIAIIAVVMSVISSYYYVRIIRWMNFEDQAEVTVIQPRIGVSASIVLGITTYGILTVMLYPAVVMSITTPIVYLV